MRGQINPVARLRAVFWFSLALSAFSFAAYRFGPIYAPPGYKGKLKSKSAALLFWAREDERLWQSRT
jgi:hypothetical protein